MTYNLFTMDKPEAASAIRLISKTKFTVVLKMYIINLDLFYFKITVEF